MKIVNKYISEVSIEAFGQEWNNPFVNGAALEYEDMAEERFKDDPEAIIVISSYIGDIDANKIKISGTKGGIEAFAAELLELVRDV